MSSLKVLYCVFFFGSHNYGWLPEADLKPYKEFKIAKMNTKKNLFKKAIDEIEAYIESVKTITEISENVPVIDKPSHPKKFKCSICDQTFKSEGSIDKHFEKFHERKIPAGPASSKKYLTHNSMLMFNGVQKMKKKCKGKENQIDFREESKTSEVLDKKNTEISLIPKVMKCPICEQICESEIGIDSHILKVHERTRAK